MSTQFTDFTLDEDVSAATSSPQEEQPPTLEYADFELDSTPQDAASFNVRDAAPLTEAISTRRLATETGMPDFLIPGDEEAPLLARELQADLEGLATRAPKTGTLLQDPGTAALLQRSVPTMSTIERDQENLRVNNLGFWGQVGHVLSNEEAERGIAAGMAGVKLMGSAANTARHLAMLDHSRETLTFMDQLDASDEPQKLVVKMDPTSSSSMQSFNPSQLRMYARAPAEQRVKMRAKVEKQIKERETAFKEGLKQVRKLQDAQRHMEGPRVGAASQITSVVDFFDYVEGNLSQMAVYMTGIVAAGLGSTLVTGSPLPGTLGAGYVAGTGEVYSSLVEKGMQSEWKTAAIAGVPYAAVELLGAPSRVMKDVMNPMLTTAAKKWAAESGKEFGEATTREYLKSLSKTELRALQDELAGGVIQRMAKEGLKGALSEAFLNELPQQIIEDIAVVSATGEDLIQDDTLVKWADAAAAGFFGGGPFSAGGALVSQVRDDIATGKARQFEDLTDELRTVHNSHMQFIEEQGTLESWVDATRGDELFQSAPEIYADHLAKVLTDDGSEQQVWVDVKAVEEFFQQEDVPLTMDDFAAAVKEVRTQMAGAQEMGGDLVLPASKVVAFLSQQDKVEGLMNLMRLSPESATKSAYDAQVEALMGPAMTKLQADEQTLAAGEAHEKRLVENFTQVGYSRKYAKHYAAAFRSFYETQAARLKGNPEALAVLEQRMVGLSAKTAEDTRVQSPQELEQSERRTVAEAMPNTRVVGEDGLPLRTLHATKGAQPVAFHEKGNDASAWFSESADFVNRFALSRYGYWKNAGLPWDAQGGFLPESVSVMPAYLDITNPFIASDIFPEAAELATEEQLSQLAQLVGVPPDVLEAEAMLYKRQETASLWNRPLDEILEEHTQLFGFDLLMAPSVVAALKAQGFDGMQSVEAGATAWLAFAPTQIKSAVGNRGTFDMSDPNILNQDIVGPLPKLERASPGPNPQAQAVVRAYAARAGIEHKRASEYVKVDEALATRIAQAYEDMEHRPQDPEVIEAYTDMIEQTVAQYRVLEEAGYTFTPMKEGMEDPYPSPSMVLADLRDNMHMYYYPTDFGFGDDTAAEFDEKDNLLLRMTDVVIEGQPLRANDVFRIVHDFYGHAPEGTLFRARGEENAWQTHQRLYTGPGRKAMTNETRGQNSWVNFGPYAEQNRGAKTEDTKFAEQKMGMLPDFVYEEGIAGDMQESVGPLPSVRDDGRVELTHWSYRDDLTTLDPAKYGTNNAGAERDRAQLPSFVPRTYYGVDVHLKGGYRPEAQNGTHVYKTSVDPDELYPLHEDPDALLREGMNTNEYEAAIKAAGYKGYWVDAPYVGRAAAVFVKLKPETTEFNQSFGELPPNISAYRAEQEARPVAYVTPEPVTNADGSFRKNSKGDITGAPEGVKTKRHVNARVKKLLAMLEHEYALMPESAYWYEDAGVALRALVGDDPALMERMVRLLAFFSPSTQVGANTTFAVTAAYQYLDGDPIVTGRFPNVTRQRIGAILEAEDMTMELPGVSDKVLNFYRNLWDAAFLSDKYEGAATMDMWMAKLFGYDEIDKVEGGGSRGSSYKLSDAQYRFANYLNDKVTDAYSKKHGVPLKPRMIQAALWAYGRNAEKYEGTDAGPTKDDLIGFDTYFARATQHVTVETRPSESSGVLLGLKDAPVNVQEAYAQKLLNLIVNDVGGNELFTRLGVPLSQADDSAGSLEGVVSPNRIMGMVTRTDKGNYDTTKADLAALSLAYIYSQDAVPWMQFDPKATAKSGAVVRPTIRFKSPPSRATMEGFNQALSEAGLGAEFTRVGNDLLIFYSGDMKPKELVDALKAVADEYEGPGADQLDSITTGTKVSGKIIDVNEDLDASWENEADAVEKLESAISERGRPDLLPWLRDRRAAVQKLNADIERNSADGTIRIEPDEPGRIEGTEFTEPGLVNEYDQSQDYSPVESLPGFHSRLTRVMAERLPKKPQTPQKMLAQVRNIANARTRTFKQDEYKWVGLEPWLENLEQERVTRDEVLQFIRDSQAKFETVTKESGFDETAFMAFVAQNMEAEYEVVPVYSLLPGHIEWLEQEHGTVDPEHFVVLEVASEGLFSREVYTTEENANADLLEELTYDDNLRDVFGERSSSTEYSSVVMGGQYAGENYREMLLKVEGNSFRHPHWGGEEGVILHLRMDDRTSVEGNRLLFVNELQSDLHQGARKLRDKEVDFIAKGLTAQLVGVDPALEAAQEDVAVKRRAVRALLNDDDATNEAIGAAEAISKEAQRVYGETAVEAEARAKEAAYKQAEAQVPKDFGYKSAEKSAVLESARKRLNEIRAEAVEVAGDFMLAEGTAQSVMGDIQSAILSGSAHDEGSEGTLATLGTLYREARALREQLLEADVANGGFPNTPFKGSKSWALLGMKRALQDAVLQGYDEIAWTTGDQQVVMESLSEEEHINGMRGFYDKLLPSIMNSYLKQWKVKVGESTIMAVDMNSLEPDVLVETKVHSIKITDEMRASIKEGQELFQEPEGTGRRGSIQFSGDQSTINLFAAHNESTMLHEAGHFFLETQRVIAESGSAPSAWMADWNATKEWLGAEDGNITREQHELYARTFEQYLRTGNAPSTRLRRHFQAFKRWLISIYRDAKQLNAPIDKTISELMDRMLATDEELEEIQTRPVFAEDENFLQFLTAAERNAYLLRLKRQSESARESLLAKAMKEAERTTKQWWKDAREKALREVDVDIAQRPVYQAIHFMRTGQLLGRNVPEGVELERIQINRPLAIEMFGEDVVKALPTGITTKTGGAHPEFLADQFGFSSASEFIIALRDAKDIKVLREEEADALMMKRHGDMLNDGTIEQRALEAMEGQDRTEVLLYEAQVLARRSNKPAAVREDIQARAQAILADTTVGDILKNLQSYYRAEVKAAAQAGRHLAKKNYELAGQAKQQQLLNHMLYREAIQQRDFFKKRLRQFKKLEKPQTRGKVKIDDDYHKKIQQLLVEYNFGSEMSAQSVERLTREALLDWVAKKETNDFAVLHVPEKLLRATKQNWRELTLDEFMSLSDMVENLETQGRMQRSVLIDGKVLDLVEAAEELADSVRNTIEEKAWVPQPRDKLPDLKNKVGNYFFGLMRARTLIRKLDGWKDDGIAHRYLLRAIDRAESDRQHRMKLTARTIEEMFKTHYGKSLRSLTELKRKTHIPELNTSLDREGLIAVALNMGNEDSANKLVGGYEKRGWTHDKVRSAIANHLTDADLAFVNDVWKKVDSFWPEIEALEKRTVGVAPAKVPASPFTLVRDDGTEIEMAGGYYPLKFDELQSDDVPDPASMAMSEIMKTGRFASAQTQKGHTAARVEHQGKPVRLDLGVLFSHVNQVVTDLTMREAIENSYRLLKHAKVRETVTDHAGLNHYQQLKLWLEDTAVDVVSTGGTMTKALDGLRAGVSIAVMGFKFTTVAVQLTGYTHSLVELGPRWAMEGVKDLMGGGNPLQLQRNLQMIMEKSHIMFDRSTTFHRDVNDAMRVMQRKGVIRGNIAKAGFWPIVKMQMVVDSATWLGAYKKGLKAYEGQEFQDAKAVEFADATVLKTQGSGLMKDLSAYERGTTDNTTRLTSTIRLFTVFQSYFITKYNLALERTAMKNLKDPMQVGQLAYEYAAMFWLEALLGEMILNKMPDFGDDEEEENFAWWSTKLALNNVTAMFPLLREISGAAQGFGGAPPGLRGLESVGSMVGQAGGAVQDWMEDDDINGYALAKSVISSLGIIAKVPVEWLNQILRGVKQEEEKGNTSWWDYVRYNKKEQ